MENFKTHLTQNGPLTDEQFNAISPSLLARHYEKGQILMRPGEVCKHSFFVESGLLRAYTINESGKTHIIQFAPENWIISDRSSAYFNEPTVLFVDAIEDTSVTLFDNNFTCQLGDIDPSYLQHNELALHNHIRHQQMRINSLLGATAEERYIDFVRQYPDLMLRVPQWMIASYLGITPESLSRVRKELAKKHFKR